MKPPAVILLSGGLDSATVLAIAREAGYACHALSLDYGQRHTAELVAAARVAKSLGAVEHRVMRLGLSDIGGSALTDDAIAVPEAPTDGIPVTYVPARNTVMLALALAWSEVLGARDIFIGVNAVDGHQIRRRGDALAHPRAVAAPVQGPDHPARPRTRRRLCANRELLSGGGGRSGVRPVRRLPSASPGIRAGRGGRSHPLQASGLMPLPMAEKAGARAFRAGPVVQKPRRDFTRALGFGYNLALSRMRLLPSG